MNRIITILPNSFEWKRDFKDHRKNVLDNYRIETIIDLPSCTFSPHVEVGTIILQLSINEPSEYFYKFNIKNDGYTQNKRREKNDGENDFDIFWKLKDSDETEKSFKNGFQKLKIAKIKEQKDWSFKLPPDFSYLFKPLTPIEQLAKLEKLKKLDLEFLELWKEQKKSMDERAERIKQRWGIQ